MYLGSLKYKSKKEGGEMIGGVLKFCEEGNFRYAEPPVLPEENGHLCSDKRFPKAMHGAAITDCFEDTLGRLWAANGEYGTQVSFCPFCGHPAATKAQEEPPDSPSDDAD